MSPQERSRTSPHFGINVTLLFHEHPRARNIKEHDEQELGRREVREGLMETLQAESCFFLKHLMVCGAFTSNVAIETLLYSVSFFGRLQEEKSIWSTFLPRYLSDRSEAGKGTGRRGKCLMKVDYYE